MRHRQDNPVLLIWKDLKVVSVKIWNVDSYFEDFLPTIQLGNCVIFNRVSNNNFVIFYRVSNNNCVLVYRVCPVRVRAEGDVSGSYSTPSTFSTLPLPVEANSSAVSSKQMSPSHVSISNFFTLSYQMMSVSPTRLRLLMWVTGRIPSECRLTDPSLDVKA